MMIEEKKIIENNFDRMREVIENTWLPINVGDTAVGETTLREGDVFRIATALINEGFRQERTGEWIERVEKLTWCEDDVEVYYDCSLCGTHNFAETPYCPCCGAKMNKENDND